jgi:signal transduction histidine kinase
VVPLRAHDRIIGSLGLVTTNDSNRQLTPDDVTLAEELARRAGVALDNARLYQAAAEARAAAEEAVTLRDQFLSIASHELKTPLTSMLLQTQLLQRRVGRAGLLAEREQRTLHVVFEQAQRLDRMITSLLDISRLELGQLSLSRATVNLCALTQRVVTEVQPTTEAHIVTCTAPEEELLVDGDELRLEQVLQNLLQNAIKYSPDGGPIEVIVNPEAGQVYLTVTDRGMGFPAETAARLFERFYRAPNADPRQISGLGIGLFVVQEIVRLHGGSVQAEPQEGGGSRFTVCLPQYRVSFANEVPA